MSEHHERADQLEREADDMARRSERLGEAISDTREDWERKKADDSVPGAQNPETGLPPEANVTTQGDEPPEAPGNDERAPWPDE
jgi:hypothetical protein